MQVNMRSKLSLSPQSYAHNLETEVYMEQAHLLAVGDHPSILIAFIFSAYKWNWYTSSFVQISTLIEVIYVPLR